MPARTACRSKIPRVDDKDLAGQMLRGNQQKDLEVVRLNHSSAYKNLNHPVIASKLEIFQPGSSGPRHCLYAVCLVITTLHIKWDDASGSSAENTEWRNKIECLVFSRYKHLQAIKKLKDRITLKRANLNYVDQRGGGLMVFADSLINKGDTRGNRLFLVLRKHEPQCCDRSRFRLISTKW